MCCLLIESQGNDQGYLCGCKQKKSCRKTSNKKLVESCVYHHAFPITVAAGILSFIASSFLILPMHKSHPTTQEIHIPQHHGHLLAMTGGKSSGELQYHHGFTCSLFPRLPTSSETRRAKAVKVNQSKKTYKYLFGHKNHWMWPFLGFKRGSL